MQYIGGKQKNGGNKIVELLAAQGLPVTEPFCGGLSVTYRLASRGILATASDACRPLMTLYCEWINGWRPPSAVTRETWEAYKAAPRPDDPMTAFCGFGCSRSGAWFSSFVERYKYTNRHVTAAEAASSSLSRKLRDVTADQLRAGDYSVSDGALIYCDKPYAGTTGYPAVGEFDHDAFWSWAEDRSSDSLVFVSEYAAPDGWSSVLSWTRQNRLATGSKTRRTEHVFVLEENLKRINRS